MALPAEPGSQLASLSPAQIQGAVFYRYGQVALEPGNKHGFPVGRAFAEEVKYPSDVLDALPPACSASFSGAGNPQAAVNLAPDQRLLDIGCGAGLDLCLYAQRFGQPARLQGLDGSKEMTQRARENLTAAGFPEVEILNRRAEETELPEKSIDLISANGIFNLSPDEDAVMSEMARILKPSGQLVFAEIVLTSPLEEQVRRSVDDWFRCIGGALMTEDLESKLRRHGFVDISFIELARNARTGHPNSSCAVVSAQRSAE